MDTQSYIKPILDAVWNYGPNVLMALALLVGGLWVIRRFSAGFQAFLKARNVDESLRPFFSSLVEVAMKVALLLVVAGRIGIETTSFIAVFSAVAFAVGLALQGSLGNFASGVLILLFRPYKVGDMLTVEEFIGVVREIQIFNTILETTQGKRIIIPNGKMTEGAIVNVGADAEVRVDVEIHVKDYSPIPLLREASSAAVMACTHRLTNKKPFVEIAGFPRDAMKVVVGCWTTGQYYHETFFALHELLKTEYDKVGIELGKEDYEGLEGPPMHG